MKTIRQEEMKRGMQRRMTQQRKGKSETKRQLRRQGGIDGWKERGTWEDTVQGTGEREREGEIEFAYR